MKKRFHFTLGPVQGFVSQARRTRDFWAGSFLLSYLTVVAMKSVEQAGGGIHFPDVKSDPLMERLRNGKGAPGIGSVPNRFVAEVPESFDGESIAVAVRDEWKRIADAVWDQDLKGINGPEKEMIWDPQIDGFWDVAWALTSDKEDSTLLDRRKNWRSHYPVEQAGDKCTMMGDWQELSGEPSPNRDKQEKFWKQVKSRVGNPLDLRDKERLCAIAYVKRRFYEVWGSLHADWKLPTAIPSVSYMAAVHWLEQAILNASGDHLEAFHAAASQATPGYGEWKTDIPCVTKAVDHRHGISHRFSSLDGRVFFRSALENSKEFDAQLSKPVLNALTDIRGTVVKRSADDLGRMLGDPSPFYAILLMDGDSLGKEMSDVKNQQHISAALADFTRLVPKVVLKNNGFLVYAGGDDVLAILPLEDALTCALDVRHAWIKAFSDKPGHLKGKTISAAIEFAHMKMPLTAILKDAHRLLDDVAKEKTGRDALAVRVWKPGGEQLTWNMKWGDGKDGTVERMNALVTKFQQEEGDEPGYASKPLYRIRERLDMLKGANDFDYAAVRDLLVAEYVTSGVLSGSNKLQVARQRIDELMPLCTGKTGFGSEAAILTRFLAQKGVER